MINTPEGQRPQRIVWSEQIPYFSVPCLKETWWPEQPPSLERIRYISGGNCIDLSSCVSFNNSGCFLWKFNDVSSCLSCSFHLRFFWNMSWSEQFVAFSYTHRVALRKTVIKRQRAGDLHYTFGGSHPECPKIYLAAIVDHSHILKDRRLDLLQVVSWAVAFPSDNCLLSRRKYDDVSSCLSLAYLLSCLQAILNNCERYACPTKAEYVPSEQRLWAFPRLKDRPTDILSNEHQFRKPTGSLCRICWLLDSGRAIL